MNKPTRQPCPAPPMPILKEGQWAGTPLDLYRYGAEGVICPACKQATYGDAGSWYCVHCGFRLKEKPDE